MAPKAPRSGPLSGWSFGVGWQANRWCKHGLAVEDAGETGGGFGMGMAGLWFGWRLGFWGFGRRLGDQAGAT